MIKIWAVLIIAVLVSFSAAGCSFGGGSVGTAGAIEAGSSPLVFPEKNPTPAGGVHLISIATSTISEFVYPADPLASADDLLNLVFAAKRQLSEKEEFYFGMATYTFGLVDIDFDGMPELFCLMSNFDNFGNFMYRFYSLKESDFCNNLLEYETNSEDLGVIKYMVKEDNGEKKMIIYDDKGHVHQWRNAVFSEIVLKDELFQINEIEVISWGGENYNFDNHTWEGESNDKLEEYLNTLDLADFLYEPISYPWQEIKNPLFIEEQKNSDDYDLLYLAYDEYLKSIKS